MPDRHRSVYVYGLATCGTAVVNAGNGAHKGDGMGQQSEVSVYGV